MHMARRGGTHVGVAGVECVGYFHRLAYGENLDHRQRLMQEIDMSSNGGPPEMQTLDQILHHFLLRFQKACLIYLDLHQNQR